MIQNDLLLVIDMQNVYLPDKDWACPNMINISRKIEKLLEANVVREVIFTEFHAPDHPKGCWNSYNEEYREINENEFLNQLADPFDKLASKYTVCSKSTYSSMRIPKVCEAAARLERVVLTGVVAECCILATMMEAIDDGFQVVYLTDCIAGQNDENEAAIRKLAESFSPMHVQVMSSEQYLEEVLK